MESSENLSPEVREQRFQQVLAGEASKTFETLEADNNHFIMLPDGVLGNRIGWTFQPATELEVLGRLGACREALVDHGADIQSLSVIDVRVDMPMADETVQTKIEPRAVLLVYKPSAEAVQRWREKTERPRPKD